MHFCPRILQVAINHFVWRLSALISSLLIFSTTPYVLPVITAVIALKQLCQSQLNVIMAAQQGKLSLRLQSVTT